MHVAECGGRIYSWLKRDSGLRERFTNLYSSFYCWLSRSFFFIRMCVEKIHQWCADDMVETANYIRMHSNLMAKKNGWSWSKIQYRKSHHNTTPKSNRMFRLLLYKAHLFSPTIEQYNVLITFVVVYFFTSRWKSYPIAMKNCNARVNTHADHFASTEKTYVLAGFWEMDGHSINNIEKYKKKYIFSFIIHIYIYWSKKRNSSESNGLMMFSGRATKNKKKLSICCVHIYLFMDARRCSSIYIPIFRVVFFFSFSSNTSKFEKVKP